MRLADIAAAAPPVPWEGEEKIPWSEPAFSERMLAEHLSQDHDLASRRRETIDRQVEWIHAHVLRERPSRILDLGCGPGFYTQRLSRLGHECVGIDYSPASIAHAREVAQNESPPIVYIEEDMCRAEFGDGYDLVMLIWGEFNAFSPKNGRLVLEKCAHSMSDGGRLLLEVQTFDGVKAIGREPATWTSAESGLFSERPFMCLKQSCWSEPHHAATTRFWVVDVETARVRMMNSSAKAYTDDEYDELLRASGFRAIRRHPSMSNETGDELSGIVVLLAEWGDDRQPTRRVVSG